MNQVDDTTLGDWASGSFSGGDSSSTTAVDASSGGIGLSGMQDLFSTIGSTFSSIYRTVNPPTVGTQVWNPTTRTYQPVGAMTPTQNIGGVSTQSLLLLGGAALLLVLVLRRT